MPTLGFQMASTIRMFAQATKDEAISSSGHGELPSSAKSSSLKTQKWRSKSPSSRHHQQQNQRWSRLLRTLRQNSPPSDEEQHPYFFGEAEATASLSLSLQSPSEAGFSSTYFRSSSLLSRSSPPPSPSPPLLVTPTNMMMSPVDEEESGPLDDGEASTMSLSHPPSQQSSSSVHFFQPLMKTQEEALSYHIAPNAHSEMGYLSVQYQGPTLAPALQRAQRTLKPILCLQLIDHVIEGGKEACRIGTEVFSHPLLVEAAETLFVTIRLTVPNATSTETGRTLNADRLRIGVFDENGKDLVPTLQGDDICRASVVDSMLQALQILNHPIPKYLQVLHEEESGERRVEVAAFAVRCHDKDYRSSSCNGCGHHSCGGSCRSVFGMDDSARGEVELASLDGVLSTQAGYIDRLKVVQVTYDPKFLTFGSLVRFALEQQVANIVYFQSNDERMAAQVEIERLKETAQAKLLTCRIKPDLNNKPALRRTPLRFVPLTPLQASRANRFVQLGRFDEAAHLLSPRQGMILMKTMHASAQRTMHNIVGIPILPAWMSVCQGQHPKMTMESWSEQVERLMGDFEHPPSMYEYNSYSLSTNCLPPGYPWIDFSRQVL